MPLFLSYLARAHAELGQFDDAWRCIGEAMTAVETTKERWCEAEVNRIAGEIALKSPRAGCGESGSVFRARARGRAPTASQILGTPRRNEPGAALARSGQGAASARTAGSGLRLVHRRVRHARSEGGEGVAGGVGVVRETCLRRRCHLRLLRCHGLCAPNQRHCPRHAADRIAFQELSRRRCAALV